MLHYRAINDVRLAAPTTGAAPAVAPDPQRRRRRRRRTKQPSTPADGMEGGTPGAPRSLSTDPHHSHAGYDAAREAHGREVEGGDETSPPTPHADDRWANMSVLSGDATTYCP